MSGFRAIAPWLLLAPALLAVLVFFVTPMAFLVFESFHDFSMTGGVGGLSLSNYQRLLTDPYYFNVLKTTFGIATLAACFSLLLGYPLALLLWKAPARLKGLLLVAIIAPLLISVIVRNFGWIVILDKYGMLNDLLKHLGFTGGFVENTHLFTTQAVLIGLVHVYLPFMVLAVYGALQKQQSRYVDAARNLGANPFRAFLLITLPLSLPGIVAGVTTVFALASGAYITVAVLGGSRVMVMSVLAYQQSLGLANWQFGSAIAMVLLVGTIVILQLFQRITRKAFLRAVTA